MVDVKGSSGIIVSLQLSIEHQKPMKKVQEASVIVNFGMEGDRHVKPDSDRQILLIEKETLDELNLDSGSVKENITAQNIALTALLAEQKLLVGNSAILEITKPCVPCSRMNEVRPGLQAEIAGRGGMFARVLRGGLIHEGDSITRIP